ncbi:MAG: DUF4249 family protein [Prevotella sp.]|nr:DUF4249 family protein [Prevotella sp.]
MRNKILRNCLLIAVGATVLFSCEKEIDMDYHQVEPLYVAEAMLNQSGTTVLLTTTQDMTDNRRYSHYVDGATIVLSSGGEVLDTLRRSRSGSYTSDVTGLAGFTYDIDIYVDGHHFSSSSTMQKEPVMNSFRFVWKDVLTERMLFGDLKLQDIPHETNYYFMHIYRNNIGFRWAVTTDERNPGQELQQLFNIATEREMDKGDTDALVDGDRIRLEIRTIDRKSYDYLYSMQSMGSSGTNPIPNFSGGCLGYFSAFHVISYSMVFKRDEVETE